MGWGCPSGEPQFSQLLNGKLTGPRSHRAGRRTHAQPLTRRAACARTRPQAGRPVGTLSPGRTPPRPPPSKLSSPVASRAPLLPRPAPFPSEFTGAESPSAPSLWGLWAASEPFWCRQMGVSPCPRQGGGSRGTTERALRRTDRGASRGDAWRPGVLRGHWGAARPAALEPCGARAQAHRSGQAGQVQGRAPASSARHWAAGGQGRDQCGPGPWAFPSPFLHKEQKQ